MRNLNSLPLVALRTIEAIGRNGTLTGAASELGVTPGALSQRLAKAEAALDRMLFVRTSTGLEPTEQCKAILPRLTRAIADLSAVVADIRDTGEKTISVTMAPNFANHWFMWRIGRFAERHPDIAIWIEASLDVIDLDAASLDVGIRLGDRSIAGKVAKKLLNERLFPVCAPELAERLRTPADIFSLPVIRDNERLRGWEPWLSAHGLSLSRLGDGPTYSDGTMCLTAAMTGQGVFMAWETLAGDALDQGLVCAPFRHRAATGEAYWLATSRAATRKPSVLKFRSWLEDEVARSVRTWRKHER